jgi:hypothetical protein
LAQSVIVGVSALAFAAPWFSSIGPPLQIAVSLFCAGLGFVAWRRHRRWDRARIVLRPDGSGGFGAGSEFEAFELESSVVLGPYIELVLVTERGTRRLALWSDAVDADVWRRLQVLLRHRSERFSDTRS